jgi:hypothetical protein
MNTNAYDLMQELADRITAGWAADNRASVAIAEDPAHALELLSAGRADGAALVLFYLNDAPDGDDFAEDTRVEAQIRVGIVQAPGLRLRDGKAAPRVLQVIDSFRRWFAGQRFASTLAETLAYRGMTHIPTAAGQALHGYAMTWAAGYAYDVDATND